MAHKKIMVFESSKGIYLLAEFVKVDYKKSQRVNENTVNSLFREESRTMDFLHNPSYSPLLPCKLLKTFLGISHSEGRSNRCRS